jgi:hypothetical protein
VVTHQPNSQHVSIHGDTKKVASGSMVARRPWAPVVASLQAGMICCFTTTSSRGHPSPPPIWECFNFSPTIFSKLFVSDSLFVRIWISSGSVRHLTKTHESSLLRVFFWTCTSWSINSMIWFFYVWCKNHAGFSFQILLMLFCFQIPFCPIHSRFIFVFW